MIYDLDSNLEHEVQDAIESMDREYGMIAIVHRLSTVKNADRIHTVDAGEIIESGTHEALLADEGEYTELYTIQSKGNFDTRSAFWGPFFGSNKFQHIWTAVNLEDKRAIGVSDRKQNRPGSGRVSGKSRLIVYSDYCFSVKRLRSFERMGYVGCLTHTPYRVNEEPEGCGDRGDVSFGSASIGTGQSRQPRNAPGHDHRGNR